MTSPDFTMAPPWSGDAWLDTDTPLSLGTSCGRGLHTVVENHDAMTPAALRAFVHECRLTRPIGIGRPVEGQSIPATVRAYAMHGPPTWTLTDRDGCVRAQHFGELDPLRLGAQFGLPMAERGGDADAIGASTGTANTTACADGRCAVPAHA